MMSQDQHSDTELLTAVSQGDAQAFGILYEKYLDPIYNYVYHRVATSNDAEDITETVFLKAWQSVIKKKPGKNIENFNAWLYRIAHNEVVNYYRNRKPDLNLETFSEELTSNTLPEERIQNREQQQKLAQLIQKLDSNMQQVIVCRFISHLSIQETAEVIGLKSGNVRVLQHRALKILREMMENEYED